MPMRRIIHGRRKKHAAPTAARRGTVESVLSCREVSACARLMTKLTTTATARIGATIHTTASSVRRESSTTTSFDIKSSKAFHQRTHQQVPAIHHHKQQD